jgi:hypothetical protein
MTRMGDPASDGTRAALVTAFATLGVLSTTQELASGALGGVEGARPELVAEETLCLVATATARATQVGLRSEPEIATQVVPVLLDLPFVYRDYLIGGAMILQQDPAFVETARHVYARLQRKRDFYAVHFPTDQFPGERALADKMALWMGRISPPGLPEMPEERLARLDVIPLLLAHLKLVLAYGRQGEAGAGHV